MAKICTFFSGSSGNCTLVSANGEAILIDAGVSTKQILTALEQNNIAPEMIKGIFITHTHSDHIKGLRVLLNKLYIPLYASKETIGTLILQDTFRNDSEYFDIEQTKDFPFDISAKFFRTNHDCEGSGGYVFELAGGQKIAICTDLGIVTDDVRNSILGCGTIVIESNHDVGMLQNGCYPFLTKQRILSDFGHLSNISCANELPALVKGGATRIILAHLSRDNNTPELARVTAESVLIENGMKANDDYLLSVAPKCGGKMMYI